MTKPMTVNEAVERLKQEISSVIEDASKWGLHSSDLRAALAVLDGKRLCDEGEAREVLMDLIRQHAKIASDDDYNSVFVLASVHGMPYKGPQFDLSAARRWLAEHGGE